MPQVDKIFTTGADLTYSIIVEFDPDTNEPRTLQDLVLDHRAFIAECRGYVDVELPDNNAARE